MFGRRMLERLARMGRDRTVGFTPVKNKNIAAQIQLRVAVIQMAEMKENGRPLPAVEAMDQARRDVAKTLPSKPIVKSYRATPIRREWLRGNRRQATGL